MTQRYCLVTKDCIAGMTDLPSDSVDLVVTSPPYNIGVKYNRYDDNRRLADYLRWTEQWVSEVRRVLKPGGSFFLNIGGIPKDPLRPYQVMPVVTTLFTLQNTIHWIKSVSLKHNGEMLSVGHFKPINSARFLNDCHEFIFHFTKTGSVPIDRMALGVPYMDKSNVKRWAHTDGKDKRCRGNVWFIPYKTIQSRNKQRPHPATFPVELVDNCIKLHGGEVSTMLDPFLGIGNSAVAAMRAGVPLFIGFDNDDYYVKVSRDEMLTKTPNFKAMAMPVSFHLFLEYQAQILAGEQPS